MTSTLEVISNGLDQKMKSISNMIDILANHNIKVLHIRELLDECRMHSINLLVKYFATPPDNLARRQSLMNRYDQMLHQECYIERFNNVVQYLCRLAMGCSFLSELNVELIKYNETNIVHVVRKNVLNRCSDCNKKMELQNDDIFNNYVTRPICRNCGLIQKNFIMHSDDDNIAMTEGRKYRRSSYDPSKNCKLWLNRIEGKESIEIPEYVLQDVKKCIKRDDIVSKNNITCDMIRNYLGAKGHSKYNKHVSLIHFKITGIEPPRFLEQEIPRIIHIFRHVVKVFDRIKPPSKLHCPYTPFFIYKIIDNIIADSGRKREFLSRIHMQSRDTVISNDILFEKIKKRIPSVFL